MLDRERRIEQYRIAQPIEELQRKAEKAKRRSGLWTQEELDIAGVEARIMAAWFREHMQ